MSDAQYLRSQPAQKAPPSPQRTATAASGSRSKRRWTYRWSTWWTAERGIPLRYPSSHPFNPLPHLRLALACGCAPDAVKRIFDSVWMSGENAADAGRFAALCEALGVPQERLSSDEIKDALRRNTEEAAARGVFGVPSFV